MPKIDIVHIFKFLIPGALAMAVLFIALHINGYPPPGWIVILSGVIYGLFYKPPVVK